jgi:hypothetical protein
MLSTSFAYYSVFRASRSGVSAEAAVVGAPDGAGCTAGGMVSDRPLDGGGAACGWLLQPVAIKNPTAAKTAVPVNR